MLDALDVPMAHAFHGAVIHMTERETARCIVLSARAKMAGTAIRVSKVDETMPPIIGTAMRCMKWMPNWKAGPFTNP